MQELSIIQRAALLRVPDLKLAPDAAVLDAPCGAGALVLALRSAGFNATGADLGEDALSALGDRFLQADLNQPLPWSSASFDAVFCIEGIEHLENRFQFVREAFRILKPGGAILITTPNIAALRSRVRYFFSGFYHKDPRPLNESLRHPLHHIGLAGYPDLRYLLHTAGFRVTAAEATHTKFVSYAYSLLAPLMYFYTRLAFRKEKDAVQRERNREIRKTLLSPPLLFGENLLIIARKPTWNEASEKTAQVSIPPDGGTYSRNK